MSDRPRYEGILMDDVSMVMVVLRGKIGEWGVAPDSAFFGSHIFEERGLKLIYACVAPASRMEHPQHHLGGEEWTMKLSILRGLVGFDPDEMRLLRWNENYAIQPQAAVFEGSVDAFVRDMTLAKLFYL